MARVHAQKARADIYRQGLRVKDPKNKSGYSFDRSKPANANDEVIIKKGETYYSWTLYKSARQISKTYPKRQQLTSSSFLQTLWDIEDQLGEISASDAEDLAGMRDEIVSSLEELRDEQEEKRSNMPEGLQDAPTGEMLQNRYDSLDEMINELEEIDLDDYDDSDLEEKDPEESEEDYETRKQEHLDEWLQGKIEELQGITYQGE